MTTKKKVIRFSGQENKPPQDNPGPATAGSVRSCTKRSLEGSTAEWNQVTYELSVIENNDDDDNGDSGDGVRIQSSRRGMISL